MAGGGIVDVTPGEGGYDFHRDDGSSVFLLSTPETDDLADRISSFRSQGMLANNFAGGREDAAGGQSVADAGAPPLASVMPDPAPPPPAPAAPAPNYAAQFVGEAQPAPAPNYAAQFVGEAQPAPMPGAQQAAPPQPQGIYDPDSAAAMARMVAMRPGSAGVTQQQLQAKAATAVEMPKGSQVTVEGATPYDEELAAQRGEATEMRREAMANRTIDERLALQQEADDAQQLQQAMAQQVSPARQALQKIEAGVQRDHQAYRSLVNEVQTGKVDRNRIFSGSTGTLAALGSVIGAAMGAYGATLGRTNNFALDLINASIDRDIQAQMNDFDRKGQAAENLYRDLMNQYGNRDQAKAALEGIQREAAKGEAMFRATRTKDAQAQNALQEWMANDLFGEAETERKIREASYGKHTQSVSAEMAYPRAASGPSLDRKLYYETYEKALENQGKRAATESGVAKAEADINQSNAQAEKYRAEATGGTDEDRRDFTTQARLVDSGKGILGKIAAASKGSIAYDPKTGAVTATGEDIPGVGAWDHKAPGSNPLKTQILVALPAIQKSIEGDAASETAINELKEAMNFGREGDVIAALNGLGMAVRAREESVLAGSTAGARAAREQERRAVNVETDAKASKALPARDRR
jgi:hypothetical protein